MKPLLFALVVAALGLVALYGHKMSCCCHRDDPGTASIGDASGASIEETCSFEEPTDAKPVKRTIQGSDPAKQLVFRVESLHCPAVKGIGCGHLLYPMLSKLDKIEGVQASSANYTGTMIRVAVVDAAAKSKVSEQVINTLKDEKATAIESDALKAALVKEQWREAWRIGDLSAIEFRAITLYRVNTFAKAQKLSEEKTAKITSIAEDAWKKLEADAKEARAPITPEQWLDRCKEAASKFLDTAKEALSDEQIERLKEALLTQCCEGDQPVAPPQPKSIDAK